MLIEVICW